MYPKKQHDPDGRRTGARHARQSRGRRGARQLGRPRLPRKGRRAEPASSSTRSSPITTATAGSSAPSSSRTGRATCSISRTTRSRLGDFKNAVHLKDIHLHQGDAVRRLPLRDGSARQRPALRRAAQRDHHHVRRLPRHDREAADADHERRRRHVGRQEPQDRAGRSGHAHHARGARASSGRTWSIINRQAAQGRCDGQPIRKLYQNSDDVAGQRWEIPQTIDVIDPALAALQRQGALRQDAACAMARLGQGARTRRRSARRSSRTPTRTMDCQICHTSWATSCFGCHLPMKANQRVPQNKYEGVIDRNFTTYNPQVVRDDVFQLGIDGTVKKNRMAVIRSSSAVVVSSQNSNREWVYSQHQTVSGDGYSGQAFNPHFPHTTSGHGTTKNCTDCHLSKANDNNAWIASLLGFGTGTVNFFGRYAWVGGEGALHGVVWTEPDEPQAAIGSHPAEARLPAELRRAPGAAAASSTEGYEHHAQGDQRPDHPRRVSLHRERARRAGGLRRRATSTRRASPSASSAAPVSPLGQRTYVRIEVRHLGGACRARSLEDADAHAESRQRGAADPSRSTATSTSTDREEGLVVVNVTTLFDGNPENNFLHRVKLHDDKGALGERDHFNPDGRLTGATLRRLRRAPRLHLHAARAGGRRFRAARRAAPRRRARPGYLRNPHARLRAVPLRLRHR